MRNWGGEGDGRWDREKRVGGKGEGEGGEVRGWEGYGAEVGKGRSEDVGGGREGVGVGKVRGRRWERGRESRWAGGGGR